MLIFSESAFPNIGYGQYFTGGLVGSTVGLGLGHAIQGRWASENGWVFTALELTGAAMIAFDPDKNKYDCKPTGSSNNFKCTQKANGISVAGGALFLTAKICEMVDVWWLPSEISLGVLPVFDQPQVLLSYSF